MTLWYLMRAFGFSALLVLTLATALGALSTRGGSTPAAIDRRIVRQLLHRSTAILGLVLLVLHLTFVVLDTSVPMSVTNVLVPLTAGYRPFAIGLGTLALYGFVIAALSGFARGRLAALPGSERRWRTVHAAAYGGWGLAMLHGLLSGTDTQRPWALASYAVCGVVVVAAVAVRLAAPPRRILDPRGHRRLTLTTGAHR